MAQGFEVFRMEKLKDEGAVVRSLRHDLDLTHENEKGEVVYYRKTRNDEKAKNNRYMWKGENQEQKFQKALKNFRSKLPEKRRKNAVLGAQCIFSFSHELLEDKKFNYMQYFAECQKFVNEHFGKDNVFNWACHLDEKTPHITFQFLPKDEKGNLNARKLFGNKKTLSAWQDKFHEEVGSKFNLKRGIKKTNIIHETLNRFYGALKNLDEDLDKLEIEKKGLTESWADYEKRIKQTLKEFVSPMLRPLASLRKEVAKLEKQQQLQEQEKKALEADREALNEAEELFEGKVSTEVEKRVLAIEKKYAHEIKVLDSWRKRSPDELEELAQEYRKVKAESGYDFMEWQKKNEKKNDRGRGGR